MIDDRQGQTLSDGKKRHMVNVYSIDKFILYLIP